MLLFGPSKIVFNPEIFTIIVQSMHYGEEVHSHFLIVLHFVENLRILNETSNVKISLHPFNFFLLVL